MAGMGRVRAPLLGLIVVWAVSACGSGSPAGASQSAGPGASSAPASASAPIASTSGTLHSTAIKACSVLDEATMSTLTGFPVKDFGPGDPVARVPFTDNSFANKNGDALHQSSCGYWETGVTGELSRDIVTTIFQGDPAKPGSATTAALHGQFAIMQDLAASLGAQPVAGIGDEAFSVTSAGGSRLVVRAGDLVVTAESIAPPNTTQLTLADLTRVVQAILAHV